MFQFHLSLIFTSLLIALSSHAVQKKGSSQTPPIKQSQSSEALLLKTLVDLTKAPMTKMVSTKSVESALIGKKTTYTGEIFLSQGKFRWDTKTPEKSTLLFDGKILWVIEDRFVTKTQLKKNLKSQTLTAILMSPKSLKKKFDLVEKTNSPSEIAFSLKPKAKDLSVNDIVITMDAASHSLKQISYNDYDVKTVIDFQNIEKLKKIEKSYFVYKPKPGDQVTEM